MHAVCRLNRYHSEHCIRFLKYSYWQQSCSLLEKLLANGTPNMG